MKVLRSLSWSFRSQEPDVHSRSRHCQKYSRFSIRKNLTIDINKIQLPIEQDCSLGSYFVDGDVVYYSVYVPVGDYEENPDAQFDVSMETEI